MNTATESEKNASAPVVPQPKTERAPFRGCDQWNRGLHPRTYLRQAHKV